MKKNHFARIPIFAFIQEVFSQKRLALGALIFLIIILTGILFLVNRAPSPPQLKIEGLSDENKTNLYNYLKSEESGFGPSLERVPPKSEEPDSIPDLWIGYWNHDLEAIEEQFSPINLKSLGPMPTSIVRMTYFNKEIKAVPLALDHVELVFRADFFSQKGLNVNDRIESLEDLENVMEALVAPNFWPLCVAGADDQALLDFISVLMVSWGDLSRYWNLIALLHQEQTPEMILSYDLGDGWMLENLVSQLGDWQRRGILDLNWIQLKKNQVQELAERELVAAVVMRLSLHRQWPFHIINRWQSSPFPFNDPGKTGQAIVAPALVALIPSNSAWTEKSREILPTLTAREFQETFVQEWKLAPVHNQAVTLDREADDLRYWAAASQYVVPGLAGAADEAVLDRLLQEFRDAIGRK